MGPGSLFCHQLGSAGLQHLSYHFSFIIFIRTSQPGSRMTQIVDDKVFSISAESRTSPVVSFHRNTSHLLSDQLVEKSVHINQSEVQSFV